MSTSYLDLVTLEFERSRYGQNNSQSCQNIPTSRIVLVSERGSVAIPEDGVFVDVDNLDHWTVQGDKTTGPRVTGHSGQTTSNAKWRPQVFPPLVRGSGNSNPSR